MSNSNGKQSTEWTWKENKKFELAIATLDDLTPETWKKLLPDFPGKTVSDMIEHHKKLEMDVAMIESGNIPVPDYQDHRFTPRSKTKTKTSTPTVRSGLESGQVPSKQLTIGQEKDKSQDGSNSPCSSQGSC